MALLYVLAYLYAFWVTYIGVMGVYRAYLDKRLSYTLLVLLTPFIIAGMLMDVLANVFIASIVFAELPKEWLVTQRLTRYVQKDKGWRKQVAVIICENLLDIFDPTGKHCQ